MTFAIAVGISLNGHGRTLSGVADLGYGSIHDRPAGRFGVRGDRRLLGVRPLRNVVSGGTAGPRHRASDHGVRPGAVTAEFEYNHVQSRTTVDVFVV